MTKSRSDRSPKIRILGVCSTIMSDFSGSLVLSHCPLAVLLSYLTDSTTFRSFLDMVCLLVWGHG
ncbi:hypothetical protein Plhal304r1_c040g0117471 [Plasmopara halstedii]